MIEERLKSLILTREASERDLAGIDVEEIRAIKSDPDNAQYKGLVADPLFEKDSVAESRRIKHRWTSEKIDADGDKITLAGWDLTSRYMGDPSKGIDGNPVFLWGHDRKSIPPIGKAVSIGIEGPYGVMDVQYAKAGIHQFADMIFELVRDGVLKATSAGFRVLEVAKLTQKQAEEEGIGPMGIKSLRHQLHEVSQVSLGSNGDALTIGVKGLVERGIVTDKTARDFAKTYPLTEQDRANRLRELTRSFVDFGRDTVKTYTVTEYPERMTASLDAVAVALQEQVKSNERFISALSDFTRKVALLGAKDGGSSEPDAAAADAQKMTSEIGRLGDGFLARLGKKQ